MMNTIHKISTDFQNRSGMARLNMVQSDSNSRTVEITMTAGAEPWIPEAVDNVFLRFRKSDGTGGSYDTMPDGTRAWTLEENRLRICMAPQVLTAAGLVEAQAVLLYADSSIATFVFQIVVEADPSLDAVTSEDYVNWTAWAQEELDRRLEEARVSGAFSGATFFPYLDGQGNLCWTNDQGAENPQGVNIVDMLLGKLNGEVFLKTYGDTMTGQLDMAGNGIKNLPEPVDPGDAVSKSHVEAAMDSRCLRTIVIAAAAGWTGSTAPYAQTVSVPEIRDTDCPHFAVVYSGNPRTVQEERTAFGLVDELRTQNGSVTLICYDEMPETDLNILLEVNR